MKSTDKSKKDPASITIEVNQSYKVLEDLTRQVLGDIRARMENLRGENEQPFTQAMLAKSLEKSLRNSTCRSFEP